MTDQQIIDRIDFIHAAGLGRGGYNIVFSPSSMQLYENDKILVNFSGTYVNPIGPFKKYVTLYARVFSYENEYKLFYKGEFWSSCPEQDCIVNYIKPFLSLFRAFVDGQISSESIRRSYEGYTAIVSNLEPRDKGAIPNWINRLRCNEIVYS